VTAGPQAAQSQLLQRAAAVLDRRHVGGVAGVLDMVDGPLIVATGRLRVAGGPAPDADTTFEIGSISNTFTALSGITAAPEVFAASQAFFRPCRGRGRTGQRPEEPPTGQRCGRWSATWGRGAFAAECPCVQQLGQQRTPLMPALGAGQSPQRAAPRYERTAPR
jgi:hypothetical protein